MRILFLTNNKNTLPLVDWLRRQGETVILFTERITLPKLRQLRPDLALSYNYRFIIADDVIAHLDGEVINLHISYLPYNRGAYPNLWSILEGTPKGVTIHYIDAGTDTGDIIAQKKLLLSNRMSLRESYEQLQAELQRLFMEIYPLRLAWRQMRRAQGEGGTKHTVSDFKQNVEPLISSWDMTGEQLLNSYQAIFGASKQSAPPNASDRP